MERRARLPIIMLLAAVALGLLVVAAAVTGAASGEAARPASPPATADSTADSVAVRVLRWWDTRRARAYARGDESALAALYVPGSRTGAADLAVLRAYRERGLRVTRMRTRLLEVRVVRAGDQRLSLVVTDKLVDAVATSGRGGRWALPRDGPTSRRVVLVRDGVWRVAEVYAAD